MRLCRLLIAGGHDALHVVDLGLQGQPDEVVMAEARSGRRILLTSDTDFGELLWRSSERFPSVLLLRRHSKLVENQAAIILVNLAAVADDLTAGSLVVITDELVRIRPLPIVNPAAPG